MLECPVCKEFVENNEKCSVCGFEYVQRLTNESELDYLKRAYLYKRHHKDAIKKNRVNKQLPKETGDPLSKEILEITLLSKEMVIQYLKNHFNTLYTKYSPKYKDLEKEDITYSAFFYGGGYPNYQLCSDNQSYFHTNQSKTEGIYVGKDGTKYRGGLSQWKYHGKGLITWNNKNKYRGDFVQGVRTGIGEFLDVTNKKYHYGRFENNFLSDFYLTLWENKAISIFESVKSDESAYDEIRYEDGSYFVGRIRNLKRNGLGLYIFQNEDFYYGGFIDDYINGFGYFFYKNGNIYVGSYKNGKRQGQGKFMWPDGQYYVGDFDQDYRQGFGEYHYPNGAYYKGEWYQGNRQGEGEYYYPDGAVYKGNWKENKRHGQGTLTKADGEVLSGTWENDEFKG